MKKLILLTIMVLLPMPLFASDSNPLETISEANERHQAETYEAKTAHSDTPLYETHGTFGDPQGDASNRNQPTFGSNDLQAGSQSESNYGYQRGRGI